VHISAKRSDLNITITTNIHLQIQQHLQLHDTTRKGEGEGRAASRKEEKVIAGVAACAVGAMTSLPLWVIMYTKRRNDRQNDQSLDLLQYHYVHTWRR